jgi:hypothetical protein
MRSEAMYQALSLVIMLLIAALYDLRYQPWWPYYINLP